MPPPDISAMNFEQLIDKEWLAVNQRGGYASSTICGLNTRKYHGLLIAAMSPPAQRMVLLSQVDEIVHGGWGSFAISSCEYPGALSPQGFRLLRAFNAHPFPRWAFQMDGITIEKSLFLLPGQNTVCLSYSLLAADRPATLEVRPLLALRGIHELMYQWNSRLSGEDRGNGQVRISATSRTPEVFFAHDGQFISQPYWYLNSIYRREQERGYGGLEDLWNPGRFQWTLEPGRTIHLVCSTDPVNVESILKDLDEYRQDLDRQTIASASADQDATLRGLTQAANSFIVNTPTGASTPRAVGIVGNYPYSAISARSALIGLGGLFLATGRSEGARDLLLNLAAQLRDGLIPTDFDEAGGMPQYNGADTSLWFINAADEYVRAAEDHETARRLLPTVEGIIDAYQTGTDLGIVCDDEGLVASQMPNIPTSWMNAKTGDWVVTPRRGQPVELNALWYNALCILGRWSTVYGDPTFATKLQAYAAKVHEAFNRRFWNPELSCCKDVVNGSDFDPSIRPNQLFAISLAYPVLETQRQAVTLQTIIRELLTPMGVRSLSACDPAYQGRYRGNVVSRDRAQHQGSVYPWLLEPLAAAYLRVHGRSKESVARVQQWLQPVIQYLQGDGLGFIAELFDGDSPQQPGGAIASALSVGKVLHCYARDVLGSGRAPRSRYDPSAEVATSPSKHPLTTGPQ